MIASVLGRAALTLVLLLGLTFVVVAPPERCPSVTPDQLRRSAQASVDWFVRNQNPDGTWLYQYDERNDTELSDYNVVRHTGAAMGLYRAALEGLPRALPSADRGAKWALAQLLERDGWAAVDWEGNVETGSTALLVAGLTLRRDLTGDPRYDAVMRRMGRFLIEQTKPSGAVLASYDPVRGAPVADDYSKYFTGEAYWALARLDLTFPGEGWGRAADRIGAYLATKRDHEEGHWPPVPDHWAAYGLAERLPLTADEVDYARNQAGQFGNQVRWVSQRFGPWGAVVRGGHVPRGGGYGVIAEGLAGLWHVARAEPQLADLRQPVADRAACNAGLAVRAQADHADAAAFARPDRVKGAWFRDGMTRMDDQQHALAGLLRTIPILQTREQAGQGRDAPSAWLWVIALVLALNPARAVFGVPRAGRSRRQIVSLVAVGGALGGLAICVAALLADPLLDLLDVSDPSLRTAAGFVAVIAGAVDVIRRPPRPDPAPPGRRAALVPVAFPLVARPTLLVMALSAGADRGVAVTAAAMVAGVAVLAAIASSWLVDRPRGGALRWTARLLAAVLIGVGVLLALDGIFDV
jgi:small neutral amino acid transporter SnatA (MarC family)